MTECIVADVKTHTLHASGVQLSKEGWRYYDAGISRRDAESLALLVNGSRLRSDRPKPDWFRKRTAPDDKESVRNTREGGAYLNIAWADSEVTFAVPPESERSNLPREAEILYEDVDAIAWRLEKLKWKYAESASLKAVPPGDWQRVLREFDQEMDAITQRSLPNGRVGW